MNLSTKQKELLENLTNEWVNVMEFDHLHLNTVYALYNKGLLDIKWKGTEPSRQMLIRRINND